MNEHCLNCAYFRQRNPKPAETHPDQVAGDCTRFPPTRTADDGFGVFPQVCGSWSCGEFKGIMPAARFNPRLPMSRDEYEVLTLVSRFCWCCYLSELRKEIDPRMTWPDALDAFHSLENRGWLIGDYGVAPEVKVEITPRGKWALTAPEAVGQHYTHDQQTVLDHVRKLGPVPIFELARHHRLPWDHGVVVIGELVSRGQVKRFMYHGREHVVAADFGRQAG